MTDRWIYASIASLVAAVVTGFLDGNRIGLISWLLLMCFCMVRAALSVGREND